MVNSYVTNIIMNNKSPLTPTNQGLPYGNRSSRLQVFCKKGVL